MLAIPVPFIVSMMLTLLALTLHIRFAKEAKLVCWFLLLCALTTATVGLRWSVNLVALRYLQPILASMIPVYAWYAFTRTHRSSASLPLKHLLGPLLVLICLLNETLPLDIILTLVYLFYGIALLRNCSSDSLRIHVTLSNWEGVKKAEHVAAWMLLFSALIDTLLSLDFSFNNGQFSLYILTLGHLILLPVLSFAVLVMNSNTLPIEADSITATVPQPKTVNVLVSAPKAQQIVQLLDEKVRDKSLYLDPDLTLDRLSRKLGIPAKQISIAVNLVHKKNISKLINQYRIEHAKQALQDSDKSITQVLMNSGFQSKSNFNREFSRITHMTPSEYRQSLTHEDNH